MLSSGSLYFESALHAREAVPPLKCTRTEQKVYKCDVFQVANIWIGQFDVEDVQDPSFLAGMRV
jgi:hypothetical protein